MDFATVDKLVGGVPFIGAHNAEYLYNFILSQKPKRILELGFAHGTATCYMAAALDALGGGKITSVDLLEAQSRFRPSAEEQLQKTNLSNYVQIIRMQTGYTWFLHDEIKRLTTNGVCKGEYDLCIIDGSKNWTIEGCAFFLVDKILNENGWIIFDDYSWTYAQADKVRDTTDGISHRKLSEAELTTPQIREVFDLLVKQHPTYSEFQVCPDLDWAMAKKCKSGEKHISVVYTETGRNILAMIMRRLIRMMRTWQRGLHREKGGRA